MTTLEDFIRSTQQATLDLSVLKWVAIIGGLALMLIAVKGARDY